MQDLWETVRNTARIPRGPAEAVRNITNTDRAPRGPAETGMLSVIDPHSTLGTGGPGNPREGTKLARPTEYLRRRCPLCFGGRNSAKMGD